MSWRTAAYLARGRGDYAAAARYYAEVDPLARQLGDPSILFVALAGQGLALDRTAWEQRSPYSGSSHKLHNSVPLDLLAFSLVTDWLVRGHPLVDALWVRGAIPDQASTPSAAWRGMGAGDSS